MSKHNRQGQPRYTQPPFVCSHCKTGDCVSCTDVMRVVAGLGEICNCERRGHGGEPVDQQIKDPFSGDVHAPGLVVTEEGEVHGK